MRASGSRQPQARTSCIVEAERVGKNGRRTRRLEIIEVERPKLDYDMPPMPSPRTVSSELEMISGSSSFLQYKVPRKLFMSECGDTGRRKKRPRKPKVAMETLDEFEFVDRSFLSVSPEVTPRLISESPREGVVSVRPRKTKKQFVIESSGAMEVGEEKMRLETHPGQAMDIVGDDVERSSGKGKLEISREETFSIESDKKKLRKSHEGDKPEEIQKQETMTQTQKASSQKTAENSEIERKNRREHKKNRHRSYRIDDEDPLSGRRHKTHRNTREEVVRSRHGRKENEKRRSAHKERQRRDVVRRKRDSESSASFQNSDDDENDQKPKNLFEFEDDTFIVPRSESTSEDGYAPSQRDESWAPNQPSSRSEKHESRSVSEVVRKEALTEKNESNFDAKKLPEVADSVATFQVEEKTDSDVSIEVSSEKESELDFRQVENEKSYESEGDQVQSEAKEEHVSDEKGNESAKENGNHEVVELEKDGDGTSDSSRFFQASDKSESDSGNETNESSDASSPEEGGNWFDGIVTSSSNSHSAKGSEPEHVEEVKPKSGGGEQDEAEAKKEEKEDKMNEIEEKKDSETEKDVVPESEEKKGEEPKERKDDESAEKKEETHESEVEKDVEIEKDELQESEEKKKDVRESDVKKDDTSEQDKGDEVEKTKDNESDEENVSESKPKKVKKDDEVEEKKDDKPEEEKDDKPEEKKDDEVEGKTDDKPEEEKVDKPEANESESKKVEQNEEPESKRSDGEQEDKVQESEEKKDDEKEDPRVETKERATPTEETKGESADQEQNANTNDDSSEKIGHFFSASESKSDATNDSEAQTESKTATPQSKDAPVSKPFERPSEPDSSAFFKTSAVSGIDSVPPTSTEGGQNWFDGIISNSCDTCEPKAVDSNPPAQDSETVPQVDPPISEEKDPDEQNKAVHEEPKMKESEPHHDNEHTKTSSGEIHEEDKRESEENLTSCQTTQEGSEARHDSENKGTATDDNEDTSGVVKRRRRRHRKHQEEQMSNAEPRKVELVDSETQAELRGEKQKKKKRRHRTNGEADQIVNESLNGSENVNSDAKVQETDGVDPKTVDGSQVQMERESKEAVESRAVQESEAHESEKPVADENDKSPDSHENNDKENEHESELHATQESEPQAIPAEKEPVKEEKSEPQTQENEDEMGHETPETSKQEKNESNETNPEAVTVTHANDESLKEEDKKSEFQISHENVTQSTKEPEVAQKSDKHDNKGDEPLKADKSESQNEASAKPETVEVQATHKDDEPSANENDAEKEIKAESQETHESEKPSRRKRKARLRSTRNLDDATQEVAHESSASPKPQATITDNESESQTLRPPEEPEKNTESEPSSKSQEPAKLNTSEEAQDVADQSIESHDQDVTKPTPTEEIIADSLTAKIDSDSDKPELSEPSHHDTGNSESLSSDSQDEGPLQTDEQKQTAPADVHETPKHSPKIEYTKDISLESSSSYPESGSSDEHSDHIISRPLVEGKKTEVMESSEFFNASSKTFASENTQSPTKVEEESASEGQTWFDGMASNPSSPPPLIKPTPTPMGSSRGDASPQRHSLVIRQQPTTTPMANSRGDASLQRQSFIVRQQPTPKAAPVPFPKYQSSAIRSLLPSKSEPPKEESPLVKSETPKEESPVVESKTPKEEEESPQREESPELSDSEIDAVTKAKAPSEKPSPEHLTSTGNSEEKPGTLVYKYWTKSMNLCKIQAMTPVDEDDVLPLDSDFELPEPKERESKRERPSITRVTLKQSRGILSESRHHHHHHHKERVGAKTTTTPTADAKPRNPPLSRFSSVRSPNDTLSQMDHVLSRFLSSTGQVEDEIAHDLRPGSSTYRDRRLTPGVPKLQPLPLTSATRTPRSTARQIRVTPDRPRRHEVRWL